MNTERELLKKAHSALSHARAGCSGTNIDEALEEIRAHLAARPVTVEPAGYLEYLKGAWFAIFTDDSQRQRPNGSAYGPKFYLHAIPRPRDIPAEPRRGIDSAELSVQADLAFHRFGNNSKRMFMSGWREAEQFHHIPASPDATDTGETN